jgi:hypothetical protein
MVLLIQQTVEEVTPLSISLKNSELRKRIWRKEDKSQKLIQLKI